MLWASLVLLCLTLLGYLPSSWAQNYKHGDFLYFRQLWPAAYCRERNVCPDTIQDRFVIGGLWVAENDGKQVIDCAQRDVSLEPSRMAQSGLVNLTSQWPNLEHMAKQRPERGDVVISEDERAAALLGEVDDPDPASAAAALGAGWRAVGVLDEPIQSTPPTIAFKASDIQFWEQQWNTYGSCIGFFNDEYEYFKNSLALLKKYDMTEILAIDRIVPKPHMRYSTYFLEQALQFVLQARPFVRCDNDIISEVGICLNFDLQLVNCTDQMVARTQSDNCVYAPIVDSPEDPQPMPWWVIIGVPTAVVLLAIIILVVSVIQRFARLTSQRQQVEGATAAPRSSSRRVTTYVATDSDTELHVPLGSEQAA